MNRTKSPLKHEEGNALAHAPYADEASWHKKNDKKEDVLTKNIKNTSQKGDNVKAVEENKVTEKEVEAELPIKTVNSDFRVKASVGMFGGGENDQLIATEGGAVSYTHLTLPTIYSV